MAKRRIFSILKVSQWTFVTYEQPRREICVDDFFHHWFGERIKGYADYYADVIFDAGIYERYNPFKKVTRTDGFLI